MNLKIISAGAGSGKTYRLTSEMVDLLKQGVRANGIIATTFTNKAASELQERVRVRLLEEGLTEQADALTNALIGTVHGLGVRLLQRFAFEAGVSPQVEIIADEDQQVLFNQSLATVLTLDRVEKMEQLSDRLGLNKRERYDWRKEVKQLTDVARANDFSIEVLEKSKALSFESFQQFLDEPSDLPEATFNEQLAQQLADTINQLENNEDSTKKTQAAAGTLKALSNELKLRNELYWHQWVKIAKTNPGAKSREDVAPLKTFANTHDTHPAFQQDIRNFINHIFDIAIAAIREYDEYKKSRGLIDYTDMEVLIKRLLEHEEVKAVLAEELDLLMVDEFQDTSPIQLEIFLKLSQLADYSVWVGDPKQSIYGFRGADPQLMQAIIEQTGGVKPEDIQEYSWRSRQDIVYAANALFTKAFPQLPPEQVALKAKRRKKADQESVNTRDEPEEMEGGLHHWHFQYDGEGSRLPAKPWMENCIAFQLRALLDGKIRIQPKGEKQVRPARPGDVAILCRSNAECQHMAEALHRAGLQAAISRSGLLATAESKLILACLKYILHPADSLSVAEILLLAADHRIEDIITDRLDFVENIQPRNQHAKWAESNDFIHRLDKLRERVVELSSAEILNLLLDELDLRRIIVRWGNVDQRLDNVDVIRQFSLQYEEACNRLHSSASLGGFLLWLNDLENNGKDMQGSGEGPESVNVLTYHKSKGLEWPIVICHSLEGKLRAEVWGVDIIPESDTVDLHNVLGNRWLRYWVNPYADQFGRTQLEERINESEVKKAKVTQALREEGRLLYVGITRARDYLIFPSTTRPTRWLNRVWHDGAEDLPTLDPHTYESPWEWNGKSLSIRTETLPNPRDFVHYEIPNSALTFIEAPQTRDLAYPARDIDLRKENLDGQFIPTVGKAMNYTHTSPLKDPADQYPAAKVMKAFFTADKLSYSREDRLIMASGLLERYELSGRMEKEDLLRHSESWQQHLQRTFRIKKSHRKYPVWHIHQDRRFHTIIDLVLETDQGLVLIQHSGFAGSASKWKGKALELASWFFLSQEASKQIFGQKQVRNFVHFVLSGVLLEVEVKASQLKLF